MRELKHLKMTADYKSCDPSNLDEWITELSPEYRQYVYTMIKSGVDRMYLLLVTDEELMKDCGMANGIHRKKVIQKITGNTVF